MTNRICYWEINLYDGPALVEFYTQLFGWETSLDERSGVYDLATAGKGGGINGGIFTGKGALPTHRCLYVDVEDVDSIVAKAEALGRSILQGPFELEGVGRLAFFQDPEGHMIGLIQRSPRQDETQP